MLKIQLHADEIGVEPAPRFATDEEIALAAKLRRQLEERYFGSSDTHSPLQGRSDEIH